MQFGLVCPNPTEYYRMTRSYDQMKAEYDLLRCNEVTDEDVMKVALGMTKQRYDYSYFPYVALSIPILLAIFYWLYFY